MVEYNLLFDKKFEKDYRKLDRSIQIEGDKKLLRLKIDHENVGKPLKFLPSLFEFYLGSYRIYYFVEESEKKIFILSIKHKDEQEKYLRKLTLEIIKKTLEENY